MKIASIQISAGFTTRMRQRTDDLLVSIHNGEVVAEIDSVPIEQEDSAQLKKTLDLVHKINRMVEEHNKSL